MPSQIFERVTHLPFYGTPRLVCRRERTNEREWVYRNVCAGLIYFRNRFIKKLHVQSVLAPARRSVQEEAEATLFELQQPRQEEEGRHEEEEEEEDEAEQQQQQRKGSASAAATG